MMYPITIPLLNPNEPEALLAVLSVVEGQQVTAGELICTLETTKSSAELAAEASGFVVGLRFAQGDTVRAAQVLCYLAESPEAQPPAPEQTPAGGGEQPPRAGLRISQPALALARQHDIDLNQLPIGPLITESAIRALIQSAVQPAAATQADFDPQTILIYGGGGHGKACLELLRALGSYRVAGFVDDGIPAGEIILGCPVLGGGEVLEELYGQGVRLAVNAVGGIGNVAVRMKVFDRLAQDGFGCPAVIHPAALVEPSAVISAGVQVFPRAYVGSEARLGFGAIVNTGAIVSHDCALGKVVNISPGAILAGAVQVGDRALIGMGVTINLMAKIGSGARIGNGATVKSDVPENGVVRAGSVWPD